jgi:osmotically-inducible protein OsmY
MNISHRAHVVIGTSAVLFALAACGQKEEPTVGQQIDGAINSAQQVAQEVRSDVQSAADSARREGEAASKALNETASDLTITTKVKAALAADDQLSALRIEVATAQGVVSLSGPAPSDDAAERASALARSVDGVIAVQNQLVISRNG